MQTRGTIYILPGLTTTQKNVEFSLQVMLTLFSHPPLLPIRFTHFCPLSHTLPTTLLHPPPGSNTRYPHIPFTNFSLPPSRFWLHLHFTSFLAFSIITFITFQIPAQVVFLFLLITHPATSTYYSSVSDP